MLRETRRPLPGLAARLARPAASVASPGRAALLSLAVCACGPPRALENDAPLQRLRWDAGDVLVGDARARIFEIESPFDREAAASLEVASSPLAPAFRFHLSPSRLAPRASLSLLVEHAPPARGQFRSRAVLRLLAGARSGFIEIEARGRGVEDALAFDPPHIDLGAVVLATQKRAPFAVENTTAQPVGVAWVGLGGAPPCALAEGPVCFQWVSSRAGDTALEPFLLEPGEVRRGELLVRPDIPGALRAEVRLRPCPSTRCAQALSVEAMGVASPLECAPSTIEFEPIFPKPLGSESLGEPSARRQLFCTNITDGPAVLSAPSLAQPPPDAFQLLSPRMPQVVEPGSTTSFVIEFAPAELGTFRGELLVSVRPAGPGGESLRVPLSGRGGGPRYEGPERLDFGRVAVGMPARRRVVIRNSGIDPMPIELERGPSPPLALFAPPSRVVPPGGAWTLTVELRATAPGRGETSIEVRAAGRPRVIAARWEAVSVGSCDYSIDPSVLDFGRVRLGDRVAAGVALENRGLEPCLVTGLSLAPEGPDPLPAASFEATLERVEVAPFERGVISVIFAPMRGGDHRASLEISLSSLERPFFDLPLSGLGSDDPLVVLPPQVDFGAAEPGCPRAPVPLHLHAFGLDRALLADVEVDQSPDGPFRVTGAPALAAPVPSDRPLGLEVSTTAERGDATGRLVLTLVRRGDLLRFVVPLRRTSAEGAEEVVLYRAPEVRPLDILFVLSAPPDSQPAVERLGDAFVSFIEPLARAGRRPRIGVTSSREPLAGDLVAGPGRPPFFDPIEEADPAAVFREAVQAAWVDEGGPEMGLEAVRRALLDPARDRGFLRQGSQLALVFVAHEDDASPGPVSAYLDAIRAARPFSDLERPLVAALVGPPPLGCAGVAGSALPAFRYAELVARSAGSLEPICVESEEAPDVAWPVKARAWGEALAHTPPTVPLAHAADPSSILVEVGGAPLPEREPPESPNGEGARRWTYLSESRSVRFEPTSAPPPSATVRIRYRIACE